MSVTCQPLVPPAWKDNPLSDEEIVERVRGGEVDLFEVLMRRHNQLLYRMVRGLLRDPAEAEDVMQEAYLRAYAHLGQYAGTARFSTWLVRIAMNAGLRRLRHRGRLIGVGGLGDCEGIAGRDGAMALQGKAPEDPERQAAGGEIARALERAVDLLPGIYRCAFVLREVEGLSTSEAAACLLVSEETVKVRLHRARALLREDLLRRVGVDAASALRFDGARCDRVVAAVLARIRAAAPAFA